MPTHDHLRTAMNDLARTTEPLPPAEVLHVARRVRRNRRMLAGAVTAAAVVLVTTGIALLTPNKHEDALPPAVTGDAVQTLQNSLSGLADGDYTFSRTGAGWIADVRRGAVHLPDSVLIEHSDTYQVLRTGSEFYMRYLIFGSPEQHEQFRTYFQQHVTGAQGQAAMKVFEQLDGTRWVRADEKKVTAAAADESLSHLDVMATLPTTGQPDATGAGTLIAAVTTAERSGDVITGTLDATRKDPALERIFSDPTYLYGVGAKTMPFRATLDGQGRLTEFIVTMPEHRMASEPAGGIEPEPPLVIKISEYGQTGAQPAPAQVDGELAADVYETLANDND
ncbi:hypothetical protein [Actinoplanes sichuanensis]|uniref:DUF2092 domain-containing protein n=1 Tax=Actinoplanes sichuanensis TaxID=512349 RepID=A0ABW4A283_9ACTN|nr:hypothetical protein [Actinoplanes sichuanensis]